MPLAPSGCVTPAEFIDRHPQELIGRLQKLVRISTVNPPGENYPAITAQLVAELVALGMAGRRYAISRAEMKAALPPEQQSFPRYNVLGRWRVPGAQKLSLIHI